MVPVEGVCIQSFQIHETESRSQTLVGDNDITCVVCLMR